MEFHERPCDTCRRRKVKCDKIVPSCKRCSKRGYECSYLDVPKKRGPPKGYLIYKKICTDKMYTNLIQLKNYNCGILKVLLKNSIIDIKENIFVSKNGSLDYVGASPFAFLVTMYYTQNTNAPNLHIKLLQDNKPKNNIYNQLETVLEKGIIMNDAIHAYFYYLHDYFPILCKKNFLSNLDSQLPCLINIICAIGCNYFGSKKYSKYFTKLASIHLRQYYNKNNLQVISTLLLMAHFQHNDTELQKGWFYLSQAIRISYSMGLNIQQKNSTSFEIRKRLWWGCHILDRMYSFSINRPVLLTETWDVQLAAEIEDEENDVGNLKSKCSILHFNYLIKLACIMDKSSSKLSFTQIKKDNEIEDQIEVQRLENMMQELYTKILYNFNKLSEKYNGHRNIINNYIDLISIYHFSTLTQFYQVIIHSKDENKAKLYKKKWIQFSNCVIDSAKNMGDEFNFNGLTYRFYCLGLAILVHVRIIQSNLPQIGTQNSRDYLSIGLRILENAIPYYDLVKECSNLFRALTNAEGIRC